MTVRKLTEIFLRMGYEEEPPLMFKDREGNIWQILEIYFADYGIDVMCQRKVKEKGHVKYSSKVFSIYRHFPEDDEGEFILRE